MASEGRLVILHNPTLKLHGTYLQACVPWVPVLQGQLREAA